MYLDQFARSILFGSRWSDKLVVAESLEVGPRSAALAELPHFPGRPVSLSKIGKADFPSVGDLQNAPARGRLLHFFANHELLAMELMALMLLRFPEADPGFRLGLAHTIREEQKHLRLYVERMEQLGTAFGDLPVSDYFWNALKSAESPLQFVVQMSLTLEQANLDFSHFYRQAVAQVGDTETAELLDVVYREEIGHVKHGLFWFNRWREDPVREDDWSAYLRLLPPPMTPRRAKGPVFCAAARREAGFSERYIREMEVYTGSKGRPPSLWIYNPLCEAEIARGKVGFTPAKTVQNLGRDLEGLPGFLALETDVVFVREQPRAEWLKDLQTAGFRMPEFRKLGNSNESVRESKLAGIEPWGWSPEVFERFKSSREKLVAADGSNGPWAQRLLENPDFSSTGLGRFYGKTWSVEFLKRWLTQHPTDQAIFGPVALVGRVFDRWDRAEEFLARELSAGRQFLAKAPWGTSGTQNKRVMQLAEIRSPIGKWIQNTIEEQGAIVIEPWLNKEIDLSLQLEVRDGTAHVLGVRRFLNGGRLEYRGTYLEPKLNSLGSEQLSFLHTKNAVAGTSPLQRWLDLARALATELAEAGYRGPAGIDAMIWRSEEGGPIFLKPLVELNPRYTMGRVALAIENIVLPGTPAAWLFLPRSTLKERGLPASLSATAEFLSERHPYKRRSASGGERICEGVVFTSDPQVAREVLTVLVVGRETLAAKYW